MEPKFKVGDTVKLITGGPIMTVTDNVMTMVLFRGTGPSSFTGNVDCSYFEGDKLINKRFPQDSLEISSK